MRKDINKPLLFEATWATKFWLLPDSVETGFFVFQRSEISYQDLGKFAQDVSELINEHVCNLINYGNLEYIEIANEYMSSDEIKRTNAKWDRMNRRRLEAGNSMISQPQVKSQRIRVRNYSPSYVE